MQDFNTHKALTIVQYVLCSLKRNSTLHETFKILYDADMSHLAKYGRTITRDWYVKMDKGPVPSGIYDLIKDLRDHRGKEDHIETIASYIGVIGDRVLTPTGDTDLDYISDSEMEVLDKSVEEVRALTFGQRTERSHGPAWTQAGWHSEINSLEIAKEGGANKEMLKYINEVEEYKKYKP